MQLRSHLGSKLSHLGVHVGHLALEQLTLPLDIAQRQQLVNHVQQLQSVLVYQLQQVLLLVFWQGRLVHCHQQVAETDNGVKRRAQRVTHVAHEYILQLLTLACSLGSLAGFCLVLMCHLSVVFSLLGVSPCHVGITQCFGGTLLSLLFTQSGFLFVFLGLLLVSLGFLLVLACQR